MEGIYEGRTIDRLKEGKNGRIGRKWNTEKDEWKTKEIKIDKDVRKENQENDQERKKYIINENWSAKCQEKWF